MLLEIREEFRRLKRRTVVSGKEVGSYRRVAPRPKCTVAPGAALGNRVGPVCCSSGCASSCLCPRKGVEERHVSCKSGENFEQKFRPQAFRQRGCLKPLFFLSWVENGGTVLVLELGTSTLARIRCDAVRMGAKSWGRPFAIERHNKRVIGIAAEHL
ncbi:hypothetical protein METBIDRAFT_154587 [Metschnikowia bicuspidata var. bicuspidata NRRL YB-4993]|uniref:Uncharacterized protein n=1 Tax=Metschnikowia bicuspidata var. bicuspidata NRRL YB-4993 TaxID=869754 RepID=A0A1A0HEU5_9ASCO|nr:hypothetical protein METBIDRAFT_154587 [Metschnikowia bicuspidata var. bicuspidata NRRL YB-4993]OBA22521.1 hypothetical protein METBIDRAFT_154587 [Metschnikowia bicuspidata var. bicuspidata NRRL YB-4993]